MDQPILSGMRTTVDLPERVMERVRGIAADRRTSVSKVIAGMVQEAVEPGIDDTLDPVQLDPVTGLVTINLGRVITSEDVRAAQDEE